MKKTNNQGHAPNYMLLGIVCILLIIGLCLVYSSSHVWAIYKFDDPFYFVKRQLLFAVAGLIGLYIIYLVPYGIWKSYAKAIFLLCLIFMLIVLIPGVGLVRGGAQSWIGVGAFSIQPAEFMKLGIVLYLSHYVTENQKSMHTFKRGFLIPLSVIGFVFILIMLQPDFGTGVVIVSACTLLLFLAGVRLKYFIYLFFLGFVSFLYLIISAPYRLKRITAFLNPWADPLGDGFQIIQSLYAIGPGKLFGVGYGNSFQKYFYLPEPQTDFIFAIAGEEFGFFGASIVICLFIALFWQGMQTALYAPDYFGKYVAFGIIALMTIQAMMNISVVIGLVPVTGITLPFLSYGGSSLTITLCAIGLLLNISKHTKR